MTDKFKRTLFIKTLGIAKAGTLLLTFKPLDRIGLKQQKIAWKVIPFAANAPQKVPVEYVNSLVFLAPQVDNENIVSASTYKSVNVGGAVSFDLDADRNLVIHATDENTMPGFIIGGNNTGKIQDISIGLQPNPKKDPQPIFNFPKVGNTSRVAAKYRPVLRAYMTSNYQEGEAISGEVQTGLIWERDLVDLHDTTNWILTYDHDSGMYSLALDDDA